MNLLFKLKSIHSKTLLPAAFFTLCYCILVQSGFAQIPSLHPDTSEKNSSQAGYPPDSLGRRDPRGTVEGFIAAVAKGDYSKASLYLRIDKELKKDQDSVKLARNLQLLLDQQGSILPYSMISDKPEGTQNDNLGPNLERVGTATVNKEPFDLILESVESENGPVWLFSSQTIERIPPKIEDAGEKALVNKVAPEILEENQWGGVPISHWLAFVTILILAYLGATGLTYVVLLLIPLIWRKARSESAEGIIKAFVLPVRLYLTIWLLIFGSQAAGISIIVRQRFNSLTLIAFVIAVFLLLWQLVDFITRLIEKRLARHRNQAGISALLFLRRAAKIALVGIALIIVLDTFGFDVTTGIAALGIGGIALALGAQKTMENFVGSVTLIADQPIRVGDFCKVGDIVGTVEQIGMRSTQIRTLDRTIVTIPNGEFSSLKIENFSPRERFWFHPVFRIRLDSTPDQIRFLLAELRTVLYAHPKVNPDPARIRFIEISTDCLKLEVFAYVDAIDFDRFLEIQEDIYLRMMDVIEKSGTSLAMPSQTVYLSRDKGISEEKASEAAEQVRKWKEAGEMPIPYFSPERIGELKNSIPYPPEGSVAAKNAKQAGKS
ncbi:mechanosensitive ion channel family protein [Pararcticibacter amylolyticus]|uniref:Mechanosensitive ion channel protein MscS n=1 Tax=Pararcticibacter amylolyticus TaxID=2173175 RepID=A0A2U2PMF9_9SPHI|nr:mechanosensitive ion channel family protein [Pararcticibacter amylolyticus]PWG82586.1 mechanosensitive ion channel protein MscS [Pararcticibacter amylolyticus]